MFTGGWIIWKKNPSKSEKFNIFNFGSAVILLVKIAIYLLAHYVKRLHKKQILFLVVWQYISFKKLKFEKKKCCLSWDTQKWSTEESLRKHRTSNNSNSAEANGVYAQKKPRIVLALLTCLIQVKISSMGYILVAKSCCQFLELYEVNLDSGKLAQNIN
jgi:hypothetical protein